MSIEVVPQPRVDHLVTMVDGMTMRRTDYRGMVWFGGRQAPQTGGMMILHKQVAAIVTPFWIPDSLAYRSEQAASIQVSIAAGTFFVPEDCALADATARLAVNEQQPQFSFVMVHMQGSARVPLGVSYDITVLAPPDSIVTGP